MSPRGSGYIYLLMRKNGLAIITHFPTSCGPRNLTGIVIAQASTTSAYLTAGQTRNIHAHEWQYNSSLVLSTFGCVHHDGLNPSLSRRRGRGSDRQQHVFSSPGPRRNRGLTSQTSKTSQTSHESHSVSYQSRDVQVSYSTFGPLGWDDEDMRLDVDESVGLHVTDAASIST